MWVLDARRTPLVEEALPAVAREVADVTGAGDTVIAVLALALAAGATLVDAARLANLAAGLVVATVRSGDGDARRARCGRRRAVDGRASHAARGPASGRRAFVAVAALLVLTGFTSEDPDSTLHANSRRASRPVRHRGGSRRSGGAIGTARGCSANIRPASSAPDRSGRARHSRRRRRRTSPASALDSRRLLLIAHAHRAPDVTRRRPHRAGAAAADAGGVHLPHPRQPRVPDARSACSRALIGIDAVRRSWRRIWIAPVALTVAALVKGVFVAVPLLAVGTWVLINPRRESGSIWRAVAAGTAGVVLLAGAAYAYRCPVPPRNR